jgi:hypothetical protein
MGGERPLSEAKGSEFHGPGNRALSHGLDIIVRLMHHDKAFCAGT